MTIDVATRQELARFGFDDAQLERFAKSLRDNPAATQPYVTGTIEQLTPGDASVLTAEHRERGLAALRAGEVGVVILAGGMATRFGGVVKAAVPVTHGKTFLGLKVADVAKLAMPVPIYVMTSFATHDRIDEQIRDEKLTGVETFPQLVSLRLTPSGELFHEPDGSLSPYATGHGDLTFALRSSGILKRFRERGGKLLFMSNVDNLGATLDPAIIGAHLAAGRAATAELVRKEKGDKGGAPARLDNVPQIIEAFRFPPSFDQDSIPLFNTNTFVFDAAAIDRDFDLTFFRVEKKVDDAKVIQFERLVGQLTAFLPTHFLEVPRGGPTGRFQPVKDPDELDHRRADIEAILRARQIL
jgi:UTP--glucose-1-phosphate uridylyltransferase